MPEPEAERGEAKAEQPRETRDTPDQVKGKVIEMRQESSGRLASAESADQTLTKRAAEMRGKMSPEEKRARQEILSAHESLDAEERRQFDEIVARLGFENQGSPLAGVSDQEVENVLAGIKEMSTQAPKEPPSVIVDSSIAGVERFEKGQAPAAKFEKALEKAESKPPELTAEQQQKLEKRLLDLGMKDKDGKPVDAKVFVEKYPKSWEQRLTKSARDRVAELEAKMKRFEGAGKLRSLTGKGRTERLVLEEEMGNALKEYAEMRGEFVGEKAARMLHERSRIADTRAVELGKEKGVGTKVYDAYKKLGEVNLTKTEWFGNSKFGKTRVGKMVGRAASLRTLTSFALLGGGLAAGAGSAVGIGAIMARRVMSGMGASIGSYDLMRMKADRGAQKMKKAPEEMNMQELTLQMEKMEAAAMMGGKRLSENDSYKSLKSELGARFAADGKERTLGDNESEMATMKLSMLMDSTDRRLGDLKAKSVRNDKIMKGTALALGVFVGSGQLAKGVKSIKEFFWGGKVAEAVAAAPAVSVEQAKILVSPEGDVSVQPPGFIEKPPVPMADLAEVHQGDSYTKIFGRQMEADPAKYGYDASKDGADVHKWAAKMARTVARDQGLLGKATDMRLRYDPSHPSKVLLRPDLSIERTGVKEYLHVNIDELPKPTAEVPVESGQIKPGVMSEGSGELKPGVIPENSGELRPGVVPEHSGELRTPVGDKPPDPSLEEQEPPGTGAVQEVAQAKAEVAADGRIGDLQVGGVKMHFEYGADGKVTRVMAEGTMSGTPAKAEALLRDDWRRLVSEKAMDVSTERDMVEGQLRDLQMDMDAYDALMKVGKVASPEAQFIKAAIDGNIAQLKQEYGEALFKSSAAAAKEAAPKVVEAVAPVVDTHINTFKVGNADMKFTYDAQGKVSGVDVRGADIDAVRQQAEQSILRQSTPVKLYGGMDFSYHSPEDIAAQRTYEAQLAEYNKLGDWRAIVSNKAEDWGKAWEEVRQQATAAQMEKNGYNALVRAGKGASAEAQYLKHAYDAKIEALKQKYGPEVLGLTPPKNPADIWNVDPGQEVGPVRFQGGGASFTYENGKIVGAATEYNFTQPGDLDKLNGMLRDNWPQQLLKGGDQGEVLKYAREMYARNKILEEMAKTGKGDSPEAAFLRDGLQKMKSAATKKYGGLFR